MTVLLSDSSFLPSVHVYFTEGGGQLQKNQLSGVKHHLLKCVPSRITILLVWVNSSKMVPSVSQQGETESFLAEDVE